MGILLKYQIIFQKGLMFHSHDTCDLTVFIHHPHPHPHRRYPYSPRANMKASCPSWKQEHSPLPSLSGACRLLIREGSPHLRPTSSLGDAEWQGCYQETKRKTGFWNN